MRQLLSQAPAFRPRAARTRPFVLASLLVTGITVACTGGGAVGPGTPPSTSHPSGGGGAGGDGGSGPASGGSGGSAPLGGSGGDGDGGAGGGAGNKGGAGGRGGADGGARDAPRGGKDAAGRTDTPGGTGGKMSGIDGGVACDDTESPDRLAVYYYSNSEASGSSIQMYFDVVNWTAFASKLSQVTVKYWFTDEGAGATNVLEQYYVPLPTNMKFVTLNPPRQDADTVLEISFTAAGDAGGSFVETRGFNFAFHKKDYTGTYDQTNDYSYDPKLKTSLGPNPRITAYINGELAWGCEPVAQ